RLDIRGRVKVLHGQNRKSEEPPLALFAICTPFGPPSLLEIPQKEVMFKSKHKLDLALVSMDQRGKMLLGYSDSELANMGGYDLVHYDDLAYVASAHQELLKTGASGMIAYRFQTKEGQWQWLQTSSRLVYKNSKPDFVISTHRPLMEEEGRDLLGKRTMDFKVSYLDAGLPNNYFSESDQLLSNTPAVAQHNLSTTPSRVNRRYKTQLRDFLSTCRTKRKLSHSSSSGQVTPPANASVTGTVVSPMPTVDYIATDGCTAYNMYPTPYAPATADHSLSPYMSHSNFQHTLYPSTTALENRYLTTTENLFHQYRPLSTYYPDYHSPAASPYVGNGFLEMSSRTTVPTYDPAATASSHHSTYRTAVMPVDDKIYSCQQVVETPPSKYPTYVDSSRSYVVTNSTKCLDVSWPYSVSPSSGIIQPVQVMSTQLELGKACSKIKHSTSVDGMSSSHSTSPANSGLLTPKMEEIKPDANMIQNEHNISQHNAVTTQHFSPITTSSMQEIPRQTVLMWGSNHVQHNSPGATNRSPASVGEYGSAPSSEGCDALKSLAEISNPDMCKWNGDNTKNEPVTQNSDPDSPHQHHQNHHNHHNSRVVMVL
ncbi:ss, partial [Trypoxylus dichotomus]